MIVSSNPEKPDVSNPEKPDVSSSKPEKLYPLAPDISIF